MNDGLTTTPAPIQLQPLERQLERSSLFTNTQLGVQAERINEIESFLYGVMDVLVKKGIAVPEELAKAAEDVSREMREKAEHAHTGLGIRIDDETDHEFVPVNCSERMHICQAICCKLDFALTVEEIEAGHAKWDLGKPYFIRHEASDACTHQHPEQKCCGIYENRPSVCKHYSCATDKRIWKNFEKMELNDEWLTQIFVERSPRLVGAFMHSAAVISDTI